ncbi:DegT/DnrJ/EryC1/StrS family aminotransferase [Phreatobacter cathodiphilus]|uniref:Aminotransferase DegT n=1 Tax=Phreatobacter cathodiphilus TaxID=1868589 RepID=A0A2S0NBJ3_9HYPH|nr:aminotransferase class I/II-fold pyridoxal phosphate-dependent enzyme [Phreatobacter cathodiphilus]AVO45528.1 hypothetical protein C6569_10880 [Phreatobacter cathodiphilus]
MVRHRFVDPVMPPPSAYAAFLQEAYDGRIFSNFGPLSRRFEERLCSRFGHRDERCVAAASATAGLSAALIVSCKAGDVLVPAFTFPASAGAVFAANLTPRVIDVDPRTWAVTRDILEQAFASERPGAVMLVAPFGMATDFSDAIAFCREQGCPVIIDNAAGLGIARKPLPAHPGVFEVFSLHATKTFCAGEGGVVFAHADRETDLRAALNFGLQRGHEGARWGFNGKMSEFHAAVALAQLDRIDEAVAHRQAYATEYLARSRRLRQTLPCGVADAPWQCIPYLALDEGDADRIEAEAARGGVEIRRYYRPSLSQWPALSQTAICPVAEDLSRRMCALPVRASDDPVVRDEIVGTVAGLLN